MFPVRREIAPVWSGEEWMRVSSLAPSTTSLPPDVQFNPSFLTPGETEVEVRVHGGPDGSLVAILPGQTVEGPRDILTLPESPSVAPPTGAFRLIVRVSDTHWDPGCEVYLVSIPFIYTLQDKPDNDYRGESQVLVGRSRRETIDPLEPPRVCSAASHSDIRQPLAFHTEILCNCAAGSRAKCRRKYQGATGCGSSWRRIPDDIISVQVLALFASLIADCNAVSVNLQNVHDAVVCISSLESTCPLNRIRLTEEEGRQSPASILNQIGRPGGSLLPVLRALDLQSIGLSALFNDFFVKLDNVFPLAQFQSFNDSREFFDEFFSMIGDFSDGGELISSSELANISSNADNERNFLGLWNTTVTEWTSGKIRPFWGPNDHIIDYASAKELIVASDRLKSITRQQGAPDPFVLLHEYVGRVLSSAGEDSNEVCAEGFVRLDAVDITEDEQTAIRVNVRNLKLDSALDQIELSLDIVRDDPLQIPLRFRIGPFVYTGIRSLGGQAALGPGQSFEATWIVQPVPDSRLTSTANYQAIVALSFNMNGRHTMMRLNSQRLSINPRPSLKLFHLIRAENATVPFSGMISIMNTGYRALDGLEIEGIRMEVTGMDGRPRPFKIDSMRLNNETVSTIPLPIPSIPSGKSATVTMNVSSIQGAGRLVSMVSSPSYRGSFIRLDDLRSFSVHAYSPEGLVVSPLDQRLPLFYYDSASGKLDNLIVTRNIQNQVVNDTMNGKPFEKLLISVRNDESPDFEGSLWTRVQIPTMPEEYRLLRLREVGTPIGQNFRGIDGGRWFETNADGTQVINFVDTEAIPRSGNVQYELVFGNPNDFVDPTFSQESYRIQILPEFWPTPGTVVGQVTAESPVNHTIRYSLYSGNNDPQYGVIPTTGEIVLNNPLRRGEESCMTLVAEDSEGLRASVPVVVNTGRPARECHVISDVSNLTPLIYIPPTTTVVPTATSDYTLPTIPTTEGTAAPPTQGTTQTMIPQTTTQEIRPSAPVTFSTFTIPTSTTEPTTEAATEGTSEAFTVGTEGTRGTETPEAPGQMTSSSGSTMTSTSTTEGTTTEPPIIVITTDAQLTPITTEPTTESQSTEEPGTTTSVSESGTTMEGSEGTSSTGESGTTITMTTTEPPTTHLFTEDQTLPPIEETTFVHTTDIGLSTSPTEITTTDEDVGGVTRISTQSGTYGTGGTRGTTGTFGTSTGSRGTTTETTEESETTTVPIISPRPTLPTIPPTLESTTSGEGGEVTTSETSSEFTTSTEPSEEGTTTEYIVSVDPTLETTITISTQETSTSFWDGSVTTITDGGSLTTNPSEESTTTEVEEATIIYTVTTDLPLQTIDPNEPSTTITTPVWPTVRPTMSRTTTERIRVSTISEDGGAVPRTTPCPSPTPLASVTEACRLKGTAPIWDLICDLSKTVRSTRTMLYDEPYL